MRFPLIMLTLLPALLIPFLTLALPSPSRPNELIPRTSETITLITSLVNVGLNAIKLDEAVRSFTPDDVDEIKTRSTNLEHSLDQALSTTRSTGNLDSLSSKKTTEICVPLKPVFADLLKVISDKRNELFEADYGDDMLQTLISLRVRSRALAKALKGITRELDGALIIFLEDLVDKQFVLTIAEYKMNRK
ncbi:hypothetical protein ASPCADRAFT_133941 [Aspergillus carbonarius ITEM 5010]|uniref:Uncharacterized protein n=1 Tax=Aspergillus carbonarius (strain ITEM 5010) TaxID=602072 RepID=A0A1R3RBL9_ASPC5|nr:hypothetical protein ASPCADRAFT_133941 [Aspergillus carbonarius ITEM 5010]